MSLYDKREFQERQDYKGLLKSSKWVQITDQTSLNALKGLLRFQSSFCDSQVVRQPCGPSLLVGILPHSDSTACFVLFCLSCLQTLFWEDINPRTYNSLVIVLYCTLRQFLIVLDCVFQTELIGLMAQQILQNAILQNKNDELFIFYTNHESLSGISMQSVVDSSQLCYCLTLIRHASFHYKLFYCMFSFYHTMCYHTKVR